MSMRLAGLGLLLIAGASAACDEALAPDASDDGGGGGGGGGQTAAEGAGNPGGAPSSGGGPIEGGGGEAAGACTAAGQAGDFDLAVTMSDGDRRALVHVPDSALQGEPVPLVIALHGFTETPEAMRDKTHLDEVADERGLIVAYPEGRNGSWNGGVCCGQSEWTGEDDVGFIAAVIDGISASHCIDPARVHVTGFSNGGFLTHSVGCALADRVASIGVVAGQEGVPSCEPSRPIAVLQIHGSADPVVPFGGNPLLGYPSTTSTVEGWAERDACSASSSVTYDADGTLCEARTDCDAGSSVELCIVDGGSHDWFGGGSAWTADGPPDGFVATLKIVDFFAAHPMP